MKKAMLDTSLIVGCDNYKALVDGDMDGILQAFRRHEIPEKGQLVKVVRVVTGGDWCICLITDVEKFSSAGGRVPCQLSLDVIVSGEREDSIRIRDMESRDESPTLESDFDNCSISHDLNPDIYDLVSDKKRKFIIRTHKDAREGDIVRVRKMLSSSVGVSEVSFLFAVVTDVLPISGLCSEVYVMSIEPRQ